MVEQKVVHLPELLLIARARRRLRRLESVRMHLQRQVEKDELDLAGRNEFLVDLREHLTGALAAVRSLEVRDLDEDEPRRALLLGRKVSYGDLAPDLGMRPGLRPE